ncbi:MAG TPA: prolyl oligopeptidase family serine peptidase, partial [Planctomycetota bacterium]|nr:prolyl oligopeptidase family serine peptidase [Planctomycetota bacterium]
GEVVYEAAGALKALVQLAGSGMHGVWIAGKGFGALVAITLAALDKRIAGLVADAPLSWGEPIEPHALVVPKWHAVTDLAELCAMMAPRPVCLVQRRAAADGLHQELADVNALAAAMRPAYRLAKKKPLLKITAPGNFAGVIGWMTATAKKEKPPAEKPQRLVRSILPERQFALTKYTQPEGWRLAARRLRQKYREISGIVGNPKPLSVQLVSRNSLPGYERAEYHVRTGQNTYANVLFMSPHGVKRRRTTILCLPGSGSDVARVEAVYAHEVTAQGWNACIMDARAALYMFYPGIAEHRAILSQSLHDLMCCMNWMCERDDVDVKRIGSMGVSQGGSHTWMLAAMDERIAAAVPVCGVCSFKSMIQNYRHEWYGGDFASFLDGGTIYYCTPGVLAVAEQQDLVGLIAPRPLMLIGANHDAWFPLDGMRESRDDLRHIYQVMRASKNFEYIEFEGEHSMPEHTRRKAYAFFRKHLA